MKKINALFLIAYIVDKGLMSLLSIVWKKIEENPLILTAFVVQEKKKYVPSC